MKAEGPLARFLVWRTRHVSARNFLLLLSSVVGVLAGLAAVALKAAVHFLQQWRDLVAVDYAYLYFVMPAVGLTLAVAMARLFGEQLGYGITDVLYSIAQRAAVLPRRKTYTHLITSTFTVGLGGSAGLEAPSVVTAAALGSNLGRVMHLSARKRTLMIGCGTAGAIAGIFNAPVAGVIFSIEVILGEVSLNAFLPLLISSISAALVANVLSDTSLLFSFRLEQAFTVAHFPYYLLLGVVCGLTAVVFRRVTTWTDQTVRRLRNRYVRLLVGGAVLGLAVLAFPAVYGEGYDLVSALLRGDAEPLRYPAAWFGAWDHRLMLLAFAAVVVLVKMIATGLTLGAGGSGGIFGPSLVVGGLAGFVFAEGLRFWWPVMPIRTENLIMTGMCGLMSGVQYAPLTAIFMIAEITGGYVLLVPLMIVSALA
ncbi:MAG: chloride channel protein, partial [Catalinimonas sp.]